MKRLAVVAALLAAALVWTIALDPGAGSRPRSGASTTVGPSTPSAEVPGLRTSAIDVPDLGGGDHRIRIGVMEPVGEPVADLLFLHGHADRLDNHRAMFTALAESGVRVVSFDLPSHGGSDAGPIDVWSFADLAELAGRVEHLTRTGERPFILAGWSFGGLLAARFAQDPAFAAEFSRPLAALVLENPAVAPLAFSGGDGVSKLRSLTHDLDAPLAGPPSPASPFLDPIFAGRLLAQAAIARSTPLPSGLPTLVVLADPEQDQYVDPGGVLAWLRGAGAAAGAAVEVSSCPGARHGTDFEAWPIGDGARSDVTKFLGVAVGARPPATPVLQEVQDACR